MVQRCVTSILHFGGVIVRQKEPKNLEAPFDRLDSYLTPTDLFYIHSHFLTPGLIGCSSIQAGSPSGPDLLCPELPRAKAIQPEILIAYQMNGRDLSRDHGFPVLAIVPNRATTRLRNPRAELRTMYTNSRHSPRDRQAFRHSQGVLRVAPDFTDQRHRARPPPPSSASRCCCEDAALSCLQAGVH